MISLIVEFFILLVFKMAANMALHAYYFDTQKQSVLHYFKQVFFKNMYYLNAEKTGYMAYKQYGVIIPLRHKDLKQVENLIYLGSSIVITEKDVNIITGKAWTALIKLSQVLKSTLPNGYL